MSMFSIKMLFIIGGLVLCALLFVGISNDTERHASVRQWRKRLRTDQARRTEKTK